MTIPHVFMGTHLFASIKRIIFTSPSPNFRLIFGEEKQSVKRKKFDLNDVFLFSSLKHHNRCLKICP